MGVLLAIALLGLGSSAASARTTVFASRPGPANPLVAAATTATSAAAFGDLDGDGDLDLVTGSLEGRLDYYENSGSAVSPVFVLRAGASNPLDGESVEFSSKPALADLDQDGDLDLIVGESTGRFAYYLNQGDAVDPVFVLRPDLNPLAGEDLGSAAAPALGDLDGDGDLDLVAGAQDGRLYYFENTSLVGAVFVARTGQANPLDGQDVGADSTPALRDLDGDGDLDLVSGSGAGTLGYFENVGTAGAPSFRALAGAANPFDGLGAILDSAPAFADLDGDADPDVITGDFLGMFTYYENLEGRLPRREPAVGISLGMDSAPALGDLDGDGDPDLLVGLQDGTFHTYTNTVSGFVAAAGSSGSPNVGLRARPTLGDLDGDGDLDLLAGDDSGAFFYFENTGSLASPFFVARTGAAHPLDGESFGMDSAPTLVDFDRDGDLDVASGNLAGELAYYENAGSARSAVLIRRTGGLDPFADVSVAGGSTPSLGDADGDGDLDLVIGQSSGALAYYENTGTLTSPDFVERTDSGHPLEGATVSPRSTPAFADVDLDGDLDLLAGGQAGTIELFENAIVAPARRAVVLTGSEDPLAGLDVGDASAPAFGDLDGDGDRDLLAGSGSGTIAFFRNTSGVGSPVFTQVSGASDPLDGEDLGDDATPALADLDRDGDLDLVVGERFGTFVYYLNIGFAGTPVFARQTGAGNPLEGQDVGDFSTPAFGDLDADGDLDLVAGEQLGTFRFYENTGTTVSPAFMPRTGGANPLDGLAVTSNAAPTLGDFDRDGDLDLVAGDQSAGFSFYENIGDATAPVFVLRTGADDPFTGAPPASYSTPTFADLDRNGDLDLFAGQLAGTFRSYRVPEPASGAMLAAGIRLLGGLGRSRRGAGRRRAR